jgi:hypothetical protein
VCYEIEQLFKFGEKLDLAALERAEKELEVESDSVEVDLEMTDYVRLLLEFGLSFFVEGTDFVDTHIIVYLHLYE